MTQSSSVQNLGELLDLWTQKFAQAGIESARLDARILAGHVLDLTPLQIAMKGDLRLDAAQAAQIENLFQRRVLREPVSHILQKRGFWTLELKVTADTLDPRGDTETLIEAVLAVAPKDQALKVIDFGTGTGAILLSLLSELPKAHGLGVDISPKALDVAKHNAQTTGLGARADFRLGDWATGLDMMADIIVSNPPYIPDLEVETLEPEVAKFEPHLALKGGEDGLDCYRALIPQIFDHLVPGGIAAVEIGKGQHDDVAQLFQRSGFANITLHKDLAQIIRVVMAQKPN